VENEWRILDRLSLGRFNHDTGLFESCYATEFQRGDFVEVSFSLDIVRRLENISTGNMSYRIYYNLKQLVRLIAAQNIPTVRTVAISFTNI
jgi:hypothetical protein